MASRRALGESRLLLAASQERLLEQPDDRLVDRLGRAASSSGPSGGPQDLTVGVVASDLVVADVVVAGRYVPAGGGGEPIAGDFCEVLSTGPDRLVFALGDVSGHGHAALGRMQALRAATRAVADELVRPREALAVLDRFCETQPEEGLATMWFGVYSPRPAG